MHYLISRLRIATSGTRFSKISDPKSHLSNCNLHVLKSCFLNVFSRIVKFGGLEPRCCEDIKELVAAEIGSKSFETFEKPVPAHQF